MFRSFSFCQFLSCFVFCKFITFRMEAFFKVATNSESKSAWYVLYQFLCFYWLSTLKAHNHDFFLQCLVSFISLSISNSQRLQVIVPSPYFIPDFWFTLRSRKQYWHRKVFTFISFYFIFLSSFLIHLSEVITALRFLSLSLMVSFPIRLSRIKQSSSSDLIVRRWSFVMSFPPC